MADRAFPPVRTIISRAVVFEQDDIDTDQILPARFMTTTQKTGLGQALFFDWRHRAGETEPHILDRIDPSAHRILIAGRNFGSGSSREHAPWALSDYGFRAIIAPSIADIFSANAARNGLLAIVAEPDACRALSDRSNADLTIDLAAQSITAQDGFVTAFEIDPFSRACLLEGRDALGWLLGAMPAIADFEQEYRP